VLQLVVTEYELDRPNIPRLFGDLELHRPLGLLLHDNSACGDMTALEHIANMKPHEVAPAQLAPFVPRYYAPVSLGGGVGSAMPEWLLGRRKEPFVDPRPRALVDTGSVSSSTPSESFA
jgi:hypothetical protein